jgi:hypothetical protein
MAIWYICWLFGIVSPVLVSIIVTNLATLVHTHEDGFNGLELLFALQHQDRALMEIINEQNPSPTLNLSRWRSLPETG